MSTQTSTPRGRGGDDRPGPTDDNPMAITIMVAVFTGMIMAGLALAVVFQPRGQPSPPDATGEYVPAQMNGSSPYRHPDL